MKQVINVSFVVIVLFISTNMFAQNKSGQKPERTPETMSQRNADRMRKDLNLNDEQTKKVYEVNLKYNKEMKLNHAKKEQERAEKMAAARKKKDQKNAELKNILTSDQYSKMIQNQEANKEKMKQKREDKKGQKGHKMLKDEAPVKQ